MGVSEYRASLKPFNVLLWDCCFKTNKQVGEREKELLRKGERDQWYSLCGNVCVRQTKSCYSGNVSCSGEREREKERPVRPNSFPRRDLSHTEVTISVSHGAFLRIKGRRDEKMKEENTKGRPILPGDLFSHTHLC